MGKSGAAATQAGNEHDAASHKMFSSWQKGAMIAGGAVAAGAAVIIGASIKAAAEYQSSTATLAAQSAISVAAANKVGTAFLSTAGDSAYSAQEMMSAYGPVSGTFITLTHHALGAKDALTVMKASTDLAEASGQDLGSTTKTLANIMLAYHVPVKDAATVTDSLFNASRLTNTGVTQLGTMMTMLRSRIQGANLSVNDMSSFMVEMASKIGNGRMAVRLAGTTIQQMVEPTGAAKKMLDQLGVSFKNAQGKFIGMPAVLDQLKLKLAGLPPVVADVTKSIGGTSAAMKSNVTASDAYRNIQEQIIQLQASKGGPGIRDQVKALRGEEAQMRLSASAAKDHAKAVGALVQPLDQTRVLQALFGKNAETMRTIVEGGSAALNKNAAVVGKAGSAHQAAEKQVNTFEGTMKLLKATLKDLEITIGQAILPVLEKMLHSILPIVKTVAEWITTHKDLTAKLLMAAVAIGTLVVAAMALAKAYKIWKEVTEAVEAAQVALDGAMDANPIFILIAAIVAIGVALYEAYNHVKWFHDFIDKAWQDIQSVTEAVWNWISNFFKKFWPILLAIATGGLGNIVLFIVQHWDQIKSIFSTAIDSIVDFFTNMPERLMDAAGDMMSALWNGITTGWDAGVSFFLGLGEKILHLLAGAPRWLLNIGKDILKGMWDGVTAYFNLNKKLWTGMLALILKLLGDGLKWLYDMGSDILTGMWNGIQDVWNAYVHFWTDLPGVILNFFGTAITWIHDVGGDIITGLWNGIKTIWGREVHFWTDLPGRIKNFFTSAVNWLKNAGGDIITGLKNGIGDIWNGISQLFENAYTGVTGFFSGAVTWLEQAGKDIIQGIINGIKSMGGMLGGALKDVINGIPGMGLLKKIPGVGSALGAIGLAKGGFFQDPTLAVIGEAGPEVVLPLNDMTRTQQIMQQSGLLKKTPGMSGVQDSGAAGSVGMPAVNSLLSSGGGGNTVIIDMAGAYLLSSSSMDDFIDRVGTRLVGTILPGSGMVIRK